MYTWQHNGRTVQNDAHSVLTKTYDLMDSWTVLKLLCVCVLTVCRRIVTESGHRVPGPYCNTSHCRVFQPSLYRPHLQRTWDRHRQETCYIAKRNWKPAKTCSCFVLSNVNTGATTVGTYSRIRTTTPATKPTLLFSKASVFVRKDKSCLWKHSYFRSTFDWKMTRPIKRACYVLSDRDS